MHLLAIIGWDPSHCHPGGAEPLVLKLATVFGRAAGLQKIHDRRSTKVSRVNGGSNCDSLNKWGQVYKRFTDFD